ncbi:hypothetical protein ACK344_06665 [Aeromonas veronii]
MNKQPAIQQLGASCVSGQKSGMQIPLQRHNRHQIADQITSTVLQSLGKPSYNHGSITHKKAE